MEDPSQRRLERQLQFLLDCDRLKRVERRNLLSDGSRRENAAEHSWHLALMALLLAEHTSEELDRLRVVEMVLVHDLVEIEAGDTYSYDSAAQAGKAEREAAAASRLFAPLPADQAARLLALWREYEAGNTAEARFAQALDRLQPVLQNFHSGGSSWRDHGVLRQQVEERTAPIAASAPALARWARELIEEAATRGWLRD